MPECWCRTEAVDKRKKSRCRINFFPAFRHSGICIWFLHHLIARVTPAAAVYRRPGCIPFYHQQYGRAGCIPFHCQKYGREGCIRFDSQQYGRLGCVLSTASSVDEKSVSISTASSTDVYGVSFPLPAVWTRRVYPFQQPAVWTSRVSSLSTSNMDVHQQGIFFHICKVFFKCRTDRHLSVRYRYRKRISNKKEWEKDIFMAPLYAETCCLPFLPLCDLIRATLGGAYSTPYYTLERPQRLSYSGL